MNDVDLRQFVRNKAIDGIVALDSERIDRLRAILEEIRDATLDDATEPLPTFRDFGSPVG